MHVYLNGVAQAPVVNYDRTIDGQGKVTAVVLPSPLTIDAEAIPDVLYVTWVHA
ncbi:hypothetical protein D3C85_1809090 [compost metagenome]